MTAGFTSETPRPQPVVHRRKFDESEIELALREYLERRGVAVPPGKVVLWGLDSRSGEPDARHITMVVETMPADANPSPAGHTSKE